MEIDSPTDIPPYSEKLGISLHLGNEEEKIFYDTKNDLEALGFDIKNNGRKTIEGAKDIGTITVIKQIHNDYTNPDTIREEEPFQYLSLIRYQKAIYDELVAQNATDIFVEGMREVQYLRGDWDDFVTSMKDRLSDTSYRNKALADFGGAIIYLIEHPEATPHFTESDEIWDEMDVYSGQEIPPELIEKREDFVIQQARGFLSGHPGAHIHIVFGALHHFENNISRGFGGKIPKIEVVSFPNIAQEYIEKSWTPIE